MLFNYPLIHAREGADATIDSGTFETLVYTGGPLRLQGWELPVVIDLAGLVNGRVMVANLDHDMHKRVGIVDEVINNGRQLRLKGRLNAATKARREVVDSAKRGYVWQSSIEVDPSKVEKIPGPSRVYVNGRNLDGPLYVTRRGILKGFGFVTHGADSDTEVRIAAARKQVQYALTASANTYYPNTYHR